MKIQITVIATAILATMLIATPTIFGNSSVNTAFAKTTHYYCFVFLVGPVGGGNSCFTNLDACEKGQNNLAANGFNGDAGRITKQCTKVAYSDKPGRYCFNLLPDDGILCSGTKKACEDGRNIAKAGPNGFRVGSPCYKV
jgi:hypothetical protein